MNNTTCFVNIYYFIKIIINLFYFYIIIFAIIILKLRDYHYNY